MPDQAILVEIARSAFEHPRTAAADLAPRLVSRLQRVYKIRLEGETLTGLIGHYQDLYLRAAALLAEYLLPGGGVYASLDKIRLPAYHQRLVEEFPQEEARLLEMMENLVIQYEYLR